MKFSRKLMAAALALIMVVSAFSLVACSGSSYTADNTKIKIGLTGPLTGPAAIYGTAVKNAAQIAIDEINEAGGLDGIEFELVMHDDKHDPANVQNLYADLFESGMQISLGTVTTKPGLEFKALSKEDNVFFLTPSATGDGIPEFSNGYQMCFADSNQGTAAAQAVFYKGVGVCAEKRLDGSLYAMHHGRTAVCGLHQLPRDHVHLPSMHAGYHDKRSRRNP